MQEFAKVFIHGNRENEHLRARGDSPLILRPVYQGVRELLRITREVKLMVLGTGTSPITLILSLLAGAF